MHHNSPRQNQGVWNKHCKNRVGQMGQNHDWYYIPKFVLKDNYIRLDLQIEYIISTIIQLHKNEKS
jgi:hypothetical protein